MAPNHTANYNYGLPDCEAIQYVPLSICASCGAEDCLRTGSLCPLDTLHYLENLCVTNEYILAHTPCTHFTIPQTNEKCYNNPKNFLAMLDSTDSVIIGPFILFLNMTHNSNFALLVTTPQNSLNMRSHCASIKDWILKSSSTPVPSRTTVHFTSLIVLRKFAIILIIASIALTLQ